MKVAVYGIKGGVGKTATAVNLAAVAAEAGRRVLVWDLDPQGAATFYFRVEPNVEGGGESLLERKKAALQAIQPTELAGVDVLPSDFSYRNFDLELRAAGKPRKRMRDILERLERSYDLILLDCPPSVSLLSEAALAAVDAALTPLIPTTLSIRTYEQLLAQRRELRLKSLTVLPFFAMADRRKRLHRDLIDLFLKSEVGFLETVIPYASEIERMGLTRRPVVESQPKSVAAEAYRALWREVSRRLDAA
ncbi:MAG: AAA family ATPase [Alphaproteobacteria bacterium]